MLGVASLRLLIGLQSPVVSQLTRSMIPAIRTTMARLEAVVAEIDAELRYVWVDNPHPDFTAMSVIGKRDDELLPNSEAEAIMNLKREVLLCGDMRQDVLRFHPSDRAHFYTMYAYPITEPDGIVSGVLTVAFDSSAASMRHARP